MLALAKPGGRAHAHLTQLLVALEKESRGVAAAAASAAVLEQGGKGQEEQGQRQRAGVEALLGGTKYEAVSSFGWDQVCGGSFLG